MTKNLWLDRMMYHFSFGLSIEDAAVLTQDEVCSGFYFETVCPGTPQNEARAKYEQTLKEIGIEWNETRA
jgi:hypothetical protein